MHLPPALSGLIDGAEMAPVLIGESGASVHRLSTRDGVFYLKSATTGDDGLVREAERLRWLAGRLSVPRVVAFTTDRGRDYLLLTSVPGVNGVELGGAHAASVVEGTALALRALHALPIDGCPFDQSVAAQLAHARQRVAAGLVDETDFDDERVGRSAHEVLREVELWRPRDEDLVLTHGDACLPNVMFDGPRFTGFVDCGRAGTSDRYQDLALAARSIAFNLGTEYVSMFFARYGLSAPDERKLAFYRLLDEFF